MITFLFCDVLTRQKIGTFDLLNVAFNDPVSGAGQLDGTLSFDPNDAEQTKLKAYCDTGRAALYVVDGRRILWPGLVVSDPWSGDQESMITITAAQARSWLGSRLHGKGTSVVKWVDKEQFQITRELITYAITDVGCPKIKLGAEVSGITRSLTIEPQSFVEIDSLIDGMANRENGFDWDIMARFAVSDGLPEWYLSLWYPERQSRGDVSVYLESTPTGGNIMSRPEWPSEPGDKFTRVYALGEGEVPAQAQVFDEDPGLDTGLVLLREKATNHQGRGITNNDTLTDHARAERRSHESGLGAYTVDVSADNPKLADYLSGDRARLVIKDSYLDVDFPAVRIVDRSVRVEDRDEATQVTLTLDLNDSEVLEEGTPRGGFNNVIPEHSDYLAWINVLDRVRRLEQKGVSLPILGADPPAGSRINVWQLGDGRIRWRDQAGVVHESATTTGSGSSGTPVTPPTTQKKRFVKTYSATWSKSYRGNGNPRDTDRIYFGKYNEDYGEQKSAIGFDYAQIESDLSAATIVKVEIFLDCLHTYSSAGTKIQFGTHNRAGTSGASTFQGNDPAHYYQGAGQWKKGDAKWDVIANLFGTQFKAGSIRGVVIKQDGQSAGRYGYAAGKTGAGSPPKIRITYDK